MRRWRGSWPLEGGRKMKARMAKEAIIRVRNRIGVLAQVTERLADKGISIEAVIATLEGGDAVIRSGDGRPPADD